MLNPIKVIFCFGMVEDLSGCIIRPRVVQQAGKGKSQFTK